MGIQRRLRATPAFFLLLLLPLIFSTLCAAKKFPSEWSFPVGAPIASSPTSDGSSGRIYFGADDGRVYALNPNGTLAWQSIAAGGLLRFSPALSPGGQALVVGSSNNDIYCVNTTTDGSIAWSFATGAPVTGSAAFTRDGAYLAQGSNDGALYYFKVQGSAGSNSYLWKYDAKAPVQSSALMFDPVGDGSSSVVVIGVTSGRVDFVSASDGALIASFAADSAVSSSPALTPDGCIVIGSEGGFLYKLRLDLATKTVAQEWAYNLYARIASKPSVDARGWVYVSTLPSAPGQVSRIYGVGAGDAGPLWSFPPKRANTSDYGTWNASVTVSELNGLLYAASSEGVVVALNLTTGKHAAPGWTAYIGDGPILTAPALSPDQQHVYVGSTDGNFYALTAMAPPKVSATPTASPSADASATATATGSATASAAPSGGGLVSATPTASTAATAAGGGGGRGSGVTAGQLAGISIGTVAATLTAAAGLVFVYRRRSRGDNGGDDDNDATPLLVTSSTSSLSSSSSSSAVAAPSGSSLAASFSQATIDARPLMENGRPFNNGHYDGGNREWTDTTPISNETYNNSFRNARKKNDTVYSFVSPVGSRPLSPHRQPPVLQPHQIVDQTPFAYAKAPARQQQFATDNRSYNSAPAYGTADAAVRITGRSPAVSITPIPAAFTGGGRSGPTRSVSKANVRA